MGYSPPTLYIRSYPVQDRGYTNFRELFFPVSRVNKDKAGRAGAIRPWPSKCFQSGSEFAS
jgi:hypothetical protein